MGGRGGGSGLSDQDKLLRDILGKRGESKEASDALINTNPHFTEGREWQNNCQRCVFAYEMRRRGYDVEAKPRIFDGTDTLPYQYAYGGWGKVLLGMDGQTVNMPSRNTIMHMDQQMAQWGDDTRAIVKVMWKGGHNGHVFIAEQMNGQTVYLDPQTGSQVDIKSYMNEAIKGRTQIIRIDNLKPSLLIKDAVKRRGT